MKTYFITLLLSAICCISYGQAITDQIQYSKGRIFYKDQRIQKPREIGSILLQSPSPDIPQFVKKYKNSNGAAAVLGGIGGGAIGYSLGSAIGGGKVNTGLLGVGAGTLLIGLLFDGVARKNLKLAVNAYNAPYSIANPITN